MHAMHPRSVRRQPGCYALHRLYRWIRIGSRCLLLHGMPCRYVFAVGRAKHVFNVRWWNLLERWWRFDVLALHGWQSIAFCRLRVLAMHSWHVFPLECAERVQYVCRRDLLEPWCHSVYTVRDRYVFQCQRCKFVCSVWAGEYCGTPRWSLDVQPLRIGNRDGRGRCVGMHTLRRGNVYRCVAVVVCELPYRLVQWAIRLRMLTLLRGALQCCRWSNIIGFMRRMYRRSNEHGGCVGLFLLRSRLISFRRHYKRLRAVRRRSVFV